MSKLSLVAAVRTRLSARALEVEVPVTLPLPANTWLPDPSFVPAPVDPHKHLLDGTYLWDEDIYTR